MFSSLLFRGVPVDVEEVRVGGGGAIFEDVHPPRVLSTLDVHVIRHDIENMSHFMRVQSLHEPDKSLFAAYFRVERVGINDVVTIGASPRYLETGGGVDVGYAQVVEVGNEARRVIIGEAAVELKPVGGDGYSRKARLFHWHFQGPGRIPGNTASTLNESPCPIRRKDSTHLAASPFPAEALPEKSAYTVFAILK